MLPIETRNLSIQYPNVIALADATFEAEVLKSGIPVLVDLDEVGTRIDQAQASFQEAKSKLVSGRGNVIKKAADILRLGARVKPDTAERLMLESSNEEDEEAALALPEPVT